jgi:predicted negative regulator of RcsB-dependent stress response
MFSGFSFGEAAYASQGTLSWQITVVGDPLYRPFARKPQELHEDLAKRNSKLIEWSHLRVVDLNIAQGFPLQEVVNYLETQPVTKTSGVLLEKLGDLYFAQGKPASAHQAYKDALKLDLTPLQRVRLEKWAANTAEAMSSKEKTE